MSGRAAWSRRVSESIWILRADYTCRWRRGLSTGRFTVNKQELQRLWREFIYHLHCAWGIPYESFSANLALTAYCKKYWAVFDKLRTFIYPPSRIDKPLKQKSLDEIVIQRVELSEYNWLYLIIYVLDWSLYVGVIARDRTWKPEHTFSAYWNDHPSNWCNILFVKGKPLFVVTMTFMATH